MIMAEPDAVAWHRRRFLKGVVIAGGATIAVPAAVQAPAPEQPDRNASPPTAAVRANEREDPPEVDRLTTERTGSDFMVTADAQTTLPFLIEAVQRETAPGGNASTEMRGRKMREAYHGFADRARGGGAGMGREPDLLYQAAVLSNQDAADLYAYLRQMPPPRDPSSIPLLRGER
jgi:hypothetical protein